MTSADVATLSKNCNSSPKFTHFDEFLDHNHAEHGSSFIRGEALHSQRGSMSHLSAQSGASTHFSRSSIFNEDHGSVHHNNFDLRTLKRQCMLNVIELLNKCFCIWHRPTRESMPRSERLYAYQLVLMKLREHMPLATFRDARNIVRQIIRSYLHRQRLDGPNSDGISRKSHTDSNQMDAGANDWQPNSNTHQIDVIKSKVYLNKLAFLRGCDDKDVEELVADKHCGFCKIGFQNTETLWTHMVSAHLPAGKQTCEDSVSAETQYTLSTTHDSLSLNRRRARNRVSRSTMERDTEGTENSFAYSELSSLRRSRRKRRNIWYNGKRGWAKNRVVSLKRLRRPHRRAMNKIKGDDISILPKTSNTLYLADYSDKFLEEFIDLYRQQECLWQHNSTIFRSRKLKEAAYDILVKKYCELRKVPTVSINKIKGLIRRIRGYYERLKYPNANPYRSHIWQRISFVDEGRTTPRRKRSRSSETNGTMVSSCITNYDCNLCSRTFKRSKSCASHILKTHPPTKCSRCGEKFNNADELVHHILFIHRRDAECPLCEGALEKWKSSTHLNTHFYKQHCPTCNETFHDQSNYRRHRLRCRKIDRYCCKYCNLNFSRTMDFRRHVKATHHDERPFKCNDCEMTFKYLAPLNKHRKQLHKPLQQGQQQNGT